MKIEKNLLEKWSFFEFNRFEFFFEIQILVNRDNQNARNMILKYLQIFANFVQKIQIQKVKLSSF